MTVQTAKMRREMGDGSRNAMEDKKNADLWDHKDRRANTETTFYQSDIESLPVSRRRKMELQRAHRRQEGENKGEPYQQNRRMRADANRDEWKRRQASIYCSKLDMTKYQKKRVRYLVDQVMDFSSFGSYSKEQCILGVVNVVAREDGRFIEDEKMFKELMNIEGLSLKDARNIRILVKDRL